MVDLYDEIDDYYYEETYKYDIKHDLGSATFKKTPLHQIGSNSQIPEEPQERHDKPNDSHYEKEIKRIDEEIEKHRQHKKEISQKLLEEKVGKYPELKQHYDEIKTLNQQLENLSTYLEKANSEYRTNLEITNRLKRRKNELGEQIDVKNSDKLQEELKKIEEQLSDQSVSEEEKKKLIQKRTSLNFEIPIVKEHDEISEQCHQSRIKTDEAHGKIEKIQHQIKEITLRKKSIAETVKQHQKEEVDILTINQLEEQKRSIHKVMKELYEMKAKINEEWKEKWRKFEEYMNHLEYIKQAKRKRSVAKKEDDIKIFVSDETEEYVACVTLIDYFKSLANPIDEKEESPRDEVHNKKLEEDNSQSIGIDSESTKKKEGKKKVSKREQKSQQSDLLVLDVNICAKLKQVGVSAPDRKSEIPQLIERLEKLKEELRANK